MSLPTSFAPLAPPVVVVGGVHLRLVDAPLACCALEAAGAITALAGDSTADDAGAPVRTVLIVSGTVTRALAPRVRAAFDALPEPKSVLAYGACAIAGGPYWDSYSVQPGAATEVPVDVLVPGCPPQPEALVAGLHELVEGLT